MADVANNKVITGARFVKKDRVIQLEIEEATALPEGNYILRSKINSLD